MPALFNDAKPTGMLSKLCRRGSGWCYIHTWRLKNQEKQLSCGGPCPHSQEARSTSPTPVSPAQGFSARERSPHNFWLWKPARILTERERAVKSQAFFLKDPHTDLLTDGLTLSSSAGEATQKESETFRKKQNCLALGQDLEGQLSTRQKPLFLCWDFPSLGLYIQVGAIPESPST